MTVEKIATGKCSSRCPGRADDGEMVVGAEVDGFMAKACAVTMADL
jgi:hypothetical protein